MWTFVTFLQNEEVHFRQQVRKVLMGTQKMKTKKTLALQAKINTLAKRFEDDEIDRAEHLEELSLMVASKKWTQSLLFISNEFSSLLYIVLC